MARRRNGQVREPHAYLKWIASTEQDPFRRLAIKMLCLISEDPELSNKEISNIIGRSEKTIRRWWKTYVDEGLGSLLGVDESGLPPLQPISSTVAEPASDYGGVTLSTFIDFLNSLPLFGIPTDFTEKLKQSLERLLPEVDHVSIACNFGFDLAQGSEYNPIVSIYQFSNQEDAPVIAHEYRETHKALTEIIGTLQQNQYSTTDYPYPQGFSYTLDNGPIIGHIVLWRRGKLPVSMETIEFMEQLRPFFGFLLTDFVARHTAVSPIESAFRKKYAYLVRDAGLTVIEQQVLVQLLMGRSYTEAAARLHKSPNTIRGQVHKIFQKCGVRNLSHLIKRHFTPFFETLEERTLGTKFDGE